VPTTDRTVAKRSAPQFERNPPVTLRYVAVGRNFRSLPLLSGGASGCSKKVSKDYNGNWAWITARIWFTEPWERNCHLGLSFDRSASGTNSSPPTKSAYESEVAQHWEAAGCDVRGAPYVVSQLTERMQTEVTSPFADDSPYPAKLAVAFLKETCEGARGLSADHTRMLKKLRGELAPQTAPSIAGPGNRPSPP